MTGALGRVDLSRYLTFDIGSKQMLGKYIRSKTMLGKAILPVQSPEQNNPTLKLALLLAEVGPDDL